MLRNKKAESNVYVVMPMPPSHIKADRIITAHPGYLPYVYYLGYFEDILDHIYIPDMRMNSRIFNLIFNL